MKFGRYIIISVIIIQILVHLFYKLSPYDYLDNKLYAYKFFFNRRVPNKLIFITIDNKWPWERERLMNLIEKITLNSPRVIGINFLIFDANNDIDYKRNIAADKKIILPFIISSENTNKSKPLHLPRPYIYNKKNLLISPIFGSQIVESEKGIYTLAYDSGYINLLRDKDGIVRRAYLVANINNIPYGAFSVKIAEKYFNLKNPAIIEADNFGKIKGIRLNDYFIRTDEYGSVLINFRNPRDSFMRISAKDFLEGNYNVNLKNKIVFLDAKIEILNKFRSPVGLLTNSEFQANITENIIMNNFLYRKRIFDLSVALFFVIILFGGRKYIRVVRRKILFTIITLCLYICISIILFRYEKLVINDVFVLSTIFLASFIIRTTK